MNNHAERLRKLCEAASKLPMAPLNYIEGRTLTHVETGEACSAGQGIGIVSFPKKFTAYAALLYETAEARATLALAARIVEAASNLPCEMLARFFDQEDAKGRWPSSGKDNQVQRDFRALDALLRQWASDAGTRESHV